MNRKNRLDVDTLAVRRMGRHLPRIASGDAPDDWEEEEKKVEETASPESAGDWRSRVAERERLAEKERLADASRSSSIERPSSALEERRVVPDERRRSFAYEEKERWSSTAERRSFAGERRSFAGGERPFDTWAPSPEKKRPRAPSVPAMSDPNDVVGIPGRMRLSRDKAPSAPASPLPSARLTRGLWADVQRHLVQAYEYLCHVGEAQQWIEGCLGEELGFDIVQMEERMRNGVVLARLVRVFEPSAVRRIYEVGL